MKGYADLLLADVNVIDVISKRIYSGSVAIKNANIIGVGKVDHLVEPKTDIQDFSGLYASPGFIDGHIHIESSMLTLTEFAKAAIPHGTTATVSDPHEIANVLGPKGFKLMLEEAKNLPLKAFFTVPSCVPSAPNLETSGSKLDAKEVKQLLKLDRIVGLGEVMNFPGVIAGDPDLMEKIRAARSLGKVVDGHAPKISGKDLRAYVEAGVQSDHECTSGEEALEKYDLGMWIMIREGSTSKDLHNVIKPFLQRELSKDRLIVVSDDLNPIDLRRGHLNNLIKKAIEEGLDSLSAIQMVSINPATYFGISPQLGSLSPGKRADIVLLEDLESMRVKAVFIDGKLAAKEGKILAKIPKFSYPPFSLKTVKVKPPIAPEDFAITAPTEKKQVKVHVIKVKDSSILTEAEVKSVQVKDSKALPDLSRDILQIAVVGRHKQTGNIGKGFMGGFSLKEGAIASTVAHDSHNLITVGTNWKDMTTAVQTILNMNGGMAVIRDGKPLASLALPIAGLMSQENVESVANRLGGLHDAVKSLGCTLDEPFMTLSFLALPVIPELKITDKGLVDVKNMRIISPLASAAPT